MTDPAGPPVLMIAATRIHVVNAVEGLPDVQAGQVFWVIARQVDYLVSSGQASIAPPGTQPPKPLMNGMKKNGSV